ncbi:GAF domain-containing protein [Novosphingobium profundi]|uniref:GAF domain-containing protein n=1 Tax=Novosphingobium profundi TaxID=1774954 RepID=UPI001BDB4839|nr:GAF domain-containing protein [Novosphingobium profundi]MBT0668014.1 GAF domain-containing protein [Novosphingobium profundi]
MKVRTFTVPGEAGGEAGEEARRLAIVDSFPVLHEPVSLDVQSLVAETAEIFEVPITLISIVTRDEQCFAASRGLDVPSTPRSISFCGHAVAAGATLVVEDALEDPRFAGNPLVIGPPHIRFYAGAPLFAAEGLAIGTLCVIDTARRRFSVDDIARLELQASRVMRRLEAARKAHP